MNEEKKAIPFALFIWSLAILFYFYEFFLGVFLGTIAPDFMKSMHLNAEEFSFIGSAYYITYSIMQTPVGVLVDRYGARRLLAIAAFLYTLGVFCISFAHSFYSAFLSRMMMGLGASFAFVSLLVLALNWFPRRQFGLFAGLAQFLGAVGPILAGAPLVYLLGKVDNNWWLILFLLGIFGISLSFSIGFFVRNKPKGKKNQIIFLNPHESLKKRTVLLLKIPQTWWVIFYAACVYASLPLLGAVWGTAYLMKRGLDHSSAAFVTSMLWFGMAIGCPFLGGGGFLTK